MRSRLRRPIDWEAWIKLLVLILVIAGFVALALATREAGMHESSHPVDRTHVDARRAASG
jgi:hypothetical protein